MRDRTAAGCDFYIFIQRQQYDFNYCMLHTYTSVLLYSKAQEIQVWRKKNHLFPSFPEKLTAEFPWGRSLPIICMQELCELRTRHDKETRKRNQLQFQITLQCHPQKKKMFYGLHEVYVNSRALIWHGEHIHACCCRDLPVVTLATHSENLCGCSITSLKRWALAIHITSLEMNNLTTPSHL